MKRTDASAGSIVWLSTASAILAAALIFALGFAYERQSREVDEQTARAEVRDALSVLRSNLRGRLDSNVQLIQGLAAVLGAEPKLEAAAFAQLAARLVDGRSETRVLAVAPDLTIRFIYPAEGNEAALGFDYRTAPEQYASIALARDLGATVIWGPAPLVQGGEGFLVRAPVYRYAIGGEGALGRAPAFWGVVSAVLDPDRLYAASGLSDPDLALDVALAARDGLGPPDAAPFFGSGDVFAQSPETARVALPYGAWELAAVPRGGWPAPPPPWGLRGLFALAALVVAGPLLAIARLDWSRQGRLAVIREREAELSRLSWRHELALAASGVGVWDVDLATGELLWDEQAKALFGQAGRAGPFAEVDWTGALHPEDRARAMAQAEAAAGGDGKFVSSYRIVRADGSIRHVRDMAALYEGPDGARRLVGLVWDVSEDVERQAELELRRLEAEAATLAKSRFLASMSHEIRTPMGGVLGLLELMLGDRLPPRQRERAAIATASAQSLLRLLNDVLDFSKLEAGKIAVAEEAADVRRIVAEVVELMEAGAAQKGLGLSWEVAEATPERIVTDPMRLRQVLTNLVSNATKFTEAGSVEVRVGYRADPAGDALLVEVSDTGIGVAPDERERIFGHFEQADNSLTRRVGGTGLGLAISRRLVELMGGGIEALGRPGGGSTFRFTVRARPAAAADATTAQAQEQEQSPDRAALRADAPALKVLVAEDNPTNQYLINAFLVAMGHAATTVGTGAAAVAAAETGGFDVVLMDVQMPDMDGLAAARAIRRMPGAAGAVPIIALTANAMPGDRDLCFAHGMSDYLAKPLGAAALRDALARARPGAPAHGPRRPAA